MFENDFCGLISVCCLFVFSVIILFYYFIIIKILLIVYTSSPSITCIFCLVLLRLLGAANHQLRVSISTA